MLEPHISESVATSMWADSDASTSGGFGACVIAGSDIYFMHDQWTDRERGIFDIADFEAIAYDFTYSFFPRVIPEAFARKRIVGRVDNENVEHAIRGNRTAKGVLNLVIKRLLLTQVQHHFMLTVTRVSTRDNELADALSRGAIEEFLKIARSLGLTPVRVLLTDNQRSLQRYEDAKASFAD